MIGAFSPNVLFMLCLVCLTQSSPTNKEILYAVVALDSLEMCIVAKSLCIYIHISESILLQENKNLKHYSLLPFLVHTFCVSNALIFFVDFSPLSTFHYSGSRAMGLFH